MCPTHLFGPPQRISLLVSWKYHRPWSVKLSAGHLGALVPGERAAQLLGQRRDRGGDRVADGFGAVTGERRPVLLPRLAAVALHAWQVQQHREAGAALDQRPDRRALEPQDQVAFPVTW